MAGLSIASNTSATDIIASIAATHTRLEKTNGRLATGLRINAPQDDPSGFVIAAKLQTRAQAYDDVALSVQNTHNAIEVASGAIDAMIAVTQRIRVLAVKASSSIYSTQQVADMQAEIAQLIHEVNSISEQTKFNGVKLLSGTPELLQPQVAQSSSAFVDSGPVGATVSVTTTMPAPPKEGNLLVAGLSHGDGYFGGGGYATIVAPAGWNLVRNSDNGGDNGLAIYTHVVTAGETGSYTWDVTNSVPGNNLGLAIAEIHNANTDSPLATEVTQHLDNVDTSNPLVTAPILANSTGLLPLAFFNAHDDGGETVTSPDWTTIEYPYQFYNGIQMQAHALTVAGETLQSGVDPHAGFLTSGYASILLVNPKLVINPTLLTTQIGAEVGETTESGILPLSAQALTLSNVDVGQSPQTAISTCDGALAVLTKQQGALGAFGLALQDFAEQANVTSVADTAAYSAIRDANIASEVSNNVRDTILQVYGTSLLAQANLSAENILTLFRGSSGA